jgi:hypothetical protein
MYQSVTIVVLLKRWRLSISLSGVSSQSGCAKLYVLSLSRENKSDISRSGDIPTLASHEICTCMHTANSPKSTHCRAIPFHDRMPLLACLFRDICLIVDIQASVTAIWYGKSRELRLNAFRVIEMGISRSVQAALHSLENASCAVRNINSTPNEALSVSSGGRHTSHAVNSTTVDPVNCPIFVRRQAKVV